MSSIVETAEQAACGKPVEGSLHAPRFNLVMVGDGGVGQSYSHKKR